MFLPLQELESRRLLTVFTVTNTNDAGAGSFRQAVLDANANPGKDDVHFNIPGAGVKRINMAAGVHSTQPLVIDASTQPGYAGKPLVELIGPGAAVPFTGISFGDEGDAIGSVVRGLAIGRFQTAVIASDAFTLEGCYVGMDAAGNPQPVQTGVADGDIDSAVTVGGTSPNAGNVFGNVTGTAISLNRGGWVYGNWIGLTPAGTLAPVGSGIVGGAAHMQIGGTVAAARNVISGATGAGISVGHSGSATIQGNYIGTDPTGMTAVPNAVGVVSSYAVDIGGVTPAERNVISGNTGAGVQVGNSVVRGNYIGLNAAGQPLGNGGPGVIAATFFRNVGSARIGGVNPGEGNVIAHNGGGGVRVTVAAGNEHNAFPATIRGNSMYANTGLGIDLGGDGVTPNDYDPPDADTGPNRRQNFPVIQVAGLVNGKTTVAGFFASAPGTSYTIDFYANAPGESQGRTFLGSTAVAFGATGSTTLNLPLPAVPAGHTITATATDTAGNTSELSAATPVYAGGDANRDGKVDFDDLLKLAQNYDKYSDGQSPVTAWAAGNFNLDQRVDFDDLLILAQNYNTGVGAAPVTAATLASALAPAKPTPTAAPKKTTPFGTKPVTPPKPVVPAAPVLLIKRTATRR